MAEEVICLAAGNELVSGGGFVPVDGRWVSRWGAEAQATAVDAKRDVHWTKERVLNAARVRDLLEVVIVFLFADTEFDK